MELIRLAAAVIGTLSIYLGYRLFCDRRPVLLTNLASGALLALFGLGILLADVRAMRPPGPDFHPAWENRKSTEDGSFEAPRLNRQTKVVERMA